MYQVKGRLVWTPRPIKNAEWSVIVRAQWATGYLTLLEKVGQELWVNEIVRLHAMLKIITTRCLPDFSLMGETDTPGRFTTVTASGHEQ